MPKDLFVWGLTAFAAFGGFLFGYDIGIINGVKEMCGFRMTFNLSYSSTGVNESCSLASCSENISESTILGLIVSVFSLGCLGGALVAGALSDLLGRKFSIMIGGLVFIVGGILQAAAYFLWMILLGRIIAGIGVGILSMVVPIYNAELAPKSLRGRLVSLNQLAITAGIMVSFLVNLGSKGVLVGWRISLGLQAVLGAILIVGMIFLPETPRWLVKKHRNDKALRVLSRVRCSAEEQVREEFNEILSTTKNGSEAGFCNSLKLLIQWKVLQRVLIGVGLQLFQQFTGMNVIMYYSTAIFCKIGVKEYASTALVGTLNFLTTFLSIVLVDKIGRKALLLLGALGMLVSIFVAANIILIWRVEEEDTQSAQVAGYMVVIFISLFVFNFAYGWGPVAWVVTSEIFPLEVRAAAVSITTGANWTGNFVVAMLTPILIASPLRIHGTFYLLSGLLLGAFLFVLLNLPETKGLSLERIDTVFALPWKERTRILYYLRCGCPWRCRSQTSSQDLTAAVPSQESDKVMLLGDQKNTGERETNN